MSGRPSPVRWSREARTDLLTEAKYIAQDNLSAAERWIERVERAVSDLALAPLSGRVVPELARPELREIVVGKHRVVYRIIRRRVQVLRIIHGRRDFLRAFRNA